MKEYDVTEEARFDADPHSVFQAVIDEGSGKAHWWEPTMEMVPKSGNGEVGSTLDIRIPGRRPIQWAARIAERVDDQRLRVEYTGGDFVGEGIFTVDRIDGQTRLRYRWHARPNSRQMRVGSYFVNVPRQHARVMRQGFEGLRTYLEAREASE